jgi:hypothetical protein
LRALLPMAAAHIIKVRDHTIHEIEATGTVLPFTRERLGAFLQ